VRVDGLVGGLPPDAAAVLVTVTSVEGSAPRGVGASMLVTARDVVGSIGGGRLEHEVTGRARSLLGGIVPDARLERHALGPGLGQCCGGAVTVWIAPFRTGESLPGWIEALRAAGETERSAVLVTVIASARADVPVGAHVVFDATRRRHAELADGPAADLERAARLHLDANAGRAASVRVGAPESSVLLLIEPDPDAPTTLVFGAGHVGRALVPILAAVPGRVTWIDSRPDAFPASVPAGVDWRVVPLPEDEVDDAPAGASFVVLTHDHALDLRLAEAILRRDDVAYFGLIGSATKRERFVRRLQVRGIGPDRMRRMRCPIGLVGVGGKTPGEVAVAIAAELLQERERRRQAVAAMGAAVSGS